MATSSRKWKTEREEKALEILKKIYPDELSCLKHIDAPDLQMPDNSIGVEVVQSLPADHIEAKALRIQDQSFKKTICKEELDFLHEHDYDPILINGVEHGYMNCCDFVEVAFQRVIETIYKKCFLAQKSKEYLKFKDLRLFVFDECSLSSDLDFPKWFIDNFKPKNCPFSRIYIFPKYEFWEYNCNLGIFINHK